jgi:V8-like Glu-specific endopeptidase
MRLANRSSDKRVCSGAAVLFIALSACATAAVGPGDVRSDPAVTAELRPVPNAGAVPFSSVCQLSIHRSTGGKVSTGALIGPNYVLTAAHNVYSPLYNRISAGRARCGRSGDSEAWSSQTPFDAKDQKTAPLYLWWPYSRDYAVVRLREPAAYQTAFRLLSPEDRQPARGDTVYVAGYPGEDEQRGFSGDMMFWAAGEVVNVTRNLLFYSVDAAGGVSGSPVWMRGPKGEYLIVGVHVAGTDTQATARRIDAGAYRRINAWMAAW